MPSPRFGPGNSGRPKGSQNKVTRSAKEALQEAFERIGDVEALSKWAAANPDKFYPIWSKILPTEVTGPDGGSLVIQIVKLSGETTDVARVE